MGTLALNYVRSSGTHAHIKCDCPEVNYELYRFSDTRCNHHQNPLELTYVSCLKLSP
jgi:hypothetical protein